MQIVGDSVANNGTLASASFVSSDSARKLHVFHLDGDTFCVYRAEVCILEQLHQISFSSFLQSKQGCGLKSSICFEFISNFAHQHLKRPSAQQQVSTLLIFSYLPECNCPRAIPTRLLGLIRIFAAFWGYGFLC